MSVGPMGASIVSSLAASNLAQRNSSDVGGAQQATANQSRTLDSVEKAEKAAGVGDPEESEKSSDRDADGRRAWERSQHDEEEAAQEETPEDATYDDRREPESGASTGHKLDLQG